MKTLKATLAAIAALFAALAGADLSGILPVLGELLPQKAVITLAILPSLAAAIVHAAEAISNAIDTVDDEWNQLRPPKGPLVLLALLSLACLALPSCVAFQAGLTGDPIPTTPVAREGGKPFEVASADIIRAENAPPDTAWGLYDAGAAAAHVRDALAVGKSSSSKPSVDLASTK